MAAVTSRLAGGSLAEAATVLMARATKHSASRGVFTAFIARI